MPDYSLADIAAATGNGGGNNNGGFGDGNGAWWLLVLFALLGGFGNNGGRNGGGQGWYPMMYGAGNIGGNELYPWLNQSQNVNDGFRDQMIQTNIQGIQQGINSLSTQLCNCCCDMRETVSNGFAGAEANANARQIANMQQAFAAQTAVTQGITGLSQQFADCCCENRLGLANLTSTILAENCADRAAISDGIRDLLTAGTANTQRIVDNDNANYRMLYDWLCQERLDRKNDEIQQLRGQVNSLQLAASQGAQTAQLLADNARQTVALEQYLNPTPIPAYVVQNPNCCQQNACGCGM